MARLVLTVRCLEDFSCSTALSSGISCACFFSVVQESIYLFLILYLVQVRLFFGICVFSVSLFFKEIIFLPIIL